MNGRTDEQKAMNYLGNTHGGMVELNGRWYIFYHRQTNQHSYSRQACAEPLERTPEGGFKQAEVTSCGLNGGPLEGKGTYPARIACNLWSKNGVCRYDKPFDKKAHPYFTQRGKDGEQDSEQYIANMQDGSVAGFKYFNMQDVSVIRVKVSGKGLGVMQVSDTPDFSRIESEISVRLEEREQVFSGALNLEKTNCPLYFRYQGEGTINFWSFDLS